MMDEKAFWAWMTASEDIIAVRRCYVDISGDLVAGILLSQIIYWFSPKSDGKNRVQVEKEGKLWLVKRRDDWWDECRISKKQYDSAIKKLEEISYEGDPLFEVKTMGFAGRRAQHIHLNIPVLIKIWLKEVVEQVPQKVSSPKGKLPKREHTSSPKGNLVGGQVPQRGISNTETTITETTNRDLYAPTSDEADAKPKRGRPRKTENKVYMASDYLENGKHHGSLKGPAGQLLEKAIIGRYTKVGQDFNLTGADFQKYRTLAKHCIESLGEEGAATMVDWFFSSNDPYWTSKLWPMGMVFHSSTINKFRERELVAKNTDNRPRDKQKHAKGIATTNERLSLRKKNEQIQ